MKPAKGLITEEKCVAYLEQVRWPQGVRCLKCDEDRISRFQAKGKTGKSRHLYQCLSCRYQFSATTGTVLHDSHFPLRKWFIAVAQVEQSRGNLSVQDLRRALGVQYKTAARLLQRIREAVPQEAFAKDAPPKPSALKQTEGAEAYFPSSEIMARLVQSSSANPKTAQPESATKETKSAPQPSPATHIEHLWNRFRLGAVDYPIAAARHLPGYVKSLSYLLGCQLLSAPPTRQLSLLAEGLKNTAVATTDVLIPSKKG